MEASGFCHLLSAGELSLTNFDTQRMEEITNRGICISSNQVTPALHLHQTSVGLFSSVFGVCVLQVQYSVIDQRPAVKMEQFCLANNVKLLTYGTLGKIQRSTPSCFCGWGYGGYLQKNSPAELQAY